MRTGQPVGGVRRRRKYQLDVLTEDRLDERTGVGYIGGDSPYAIMGLNGKGVCFNKKTGMVIVQHLIELMNNEEETG